MTELYIGTQSQIYNHFKNYNCSGYDEDLIRRKIAEAPVWHQRAKDIKARTDATRKELQAFRDEFVAWCYDIKENWLGDYIKNKGTLAEKINAIAGRTYGMAEGQTTLLNFIEKTRKDFEDARERTRILDEQEDYLDRCLKLLSREDYLEVMHGNPKGSVADILPLKSKREILDYLPDGYEYPAE